VTATRALPLALLALGLLQMTGDALEHLGATRVGPAVKGLAAATAASPAPKVFSAVRGLETYSTQFVIEWDEPGGPRAEPLTPERYARLRGPYNRRNAYGAALAYGPVLATNPRTRPMLDSVLAFALTDEVPLLAELGLDASARTSPIRVRYEPLASAHGDWPRLIEAPQR
jgi:hypothetical protein